MNLRLRLGAATVGIALLFASCTDISQLGNTLGELREVYAEVTRLARTDAVRIDVQNSRYLRIDIINSPLKDLPLVERQQRAREIAKRAYMSYSSRSALRVVDVAFVIRDTRFFLLTYTDGRDSFRFETADLDPVPTGLTEHWVPPATPPNDLYFIAIGEVPTDLVTVMVSHFQEKLGIPITVLPGLSLDQVTFDAKRSQMVADELIAGVRFRYATLARSARTRVIGITPYDMYMTATQDTWRFTYSLRSHEDHFAVVSYARMDPANLGAAPNEELLRSRLRKMLTKNIGLMYYGLPLSADPRSVLYGNILGSEELDYMSEFFDPQS